MWYENTLHSREGSIMSSVCYLEIPKERAINIMCDNVENIWSKDKEDSIRLETKTNYGDTQWVATLYDYELSDERGTKMKYCTNYPAAFGKGKTGKRIERAVASVEQYEV